MGKVETAERIKSIVKAYVEAERVFISGCPYLQENARKGSLAMLDNEEKIIREFLEKL